MTCAIYCRLSKEDENTLQESESIQNQKNLLVNHAVQQEWDIFNIYCDDDYSGADGNRPEWNEMLRAAQAGRFQIVLCKNQSRFTRDLEMVEKYIHGLFPMWGIRFVALLDNVDTDVKGNKKARQINGLINEWYLEDLSENVRAVLDQKRRAGKYIGSFPAYGYRKDPVDRNHLVVDEEAAEIVRKIYGLYLSGMGTHAIAHRLNEAGIPNPSRYKQDKGTGYVNGNAATGRQGCWNGTSVARILKNEVYNGNLVQGKKRKASYKSKRLLDVPKDQWFRAEGTHEAVIDRETFDAVQHRIGNRVRSDGTGKTHMLAGKVKCADCGSTMQRLTHTYKGTQKSYLQFKLYAVTRKAPRCTGHTIRLDKLTEVIQERIRAYTAEFYELSDLRRFRVEADYQIRNERAKKEIALLRRQEAQLQEALKNLYLDKVDGLVTTEQFLEMNNGLLADKQLKAKRISALEKQLGDTGRQRKDDLVLQVQVSELITMQTVSRELVDLLIDSIEVGEKDKETARQPVKINWRI